MKSVDRLEKGDIRQVKELDQQVVMKSADEEEQRLQNQNEEEGLPPLFFRFFRKCRRWKYWLESILIVVLSKHLDQMGGPRDVRHGHHSRKRPRSNRYETKKELISVGRSKNIDIKSIDMTINGEYLLQNATLRYGDGSELRKE